MEPLHPAGWSKNLRGFNDAASPGIVAAYGRPVAPEEASGVRDEFEGRRKFDKCMEVGILGG
jgi:hypothetical protein